MGLIDEGGADDGGVKDCGVEDCGVTDGMGGGVESGADERAVAAARATSATMTLTSRLPRTARPRRHAHNL